MGEHLDRARDEAGRHQRDGWSTANSPDERTVPGILVGILDALIAIAERLPEPTTHPSASAGLAGSEGERDE